MSGPLIICVGIVYASIAVMQWRAGNVAMAIVFSGYAFSNAGLYLAAK